MAPKELIVAPRPKLLQRRLRALRGILVFLEARQSIPGPLRPGLAVSKEGRFERNTIAIYSSTPCAKSTMRSKQNRAN
jgi:hypothetical protein